MSVHKSYFSKNNTLLSYDETNTAKNPVTEISLEDAKKRNQKEDLKIEDEIFEELPAVDFGRIAAQTAKQIITQSVRDAERERQYNDYKDRKEQI